MTSSSLPRTFTAAVWLFIALLGAAFLAAEGQAQNVKAGKGKAKDGGNPARWEETIKKFEAADAGAPPPRGAVLLVGGSNARRWADVSTYFPQHQVINRGFGGAQLTDVLHYAGRIVLPYAPKTILLNAGGNDLAAGKSPGQVRDAARAFITQVHTTLPDTRIYCLGLPPVRRSSSSPEVLAEIQKMNALMAELAKIEKNVEFIDLFPAFLDAQGQPKADFFVEDGTHFSPKGYAAVRDLLKGKF
ncbi:GDSL-type esterase/lipase family protein [Prosthecobacter sp.]|uniref:GDSL-type esterase/lipase family protein n=1 Tax=Prosthecobacter sp. TaxID=1965333 RepID=UPI0037843AB2